MPFKVNSNRKVILSGYGYFMTQNSSALSVRTKLTAKQVGRSAELIVLVCFEIFELRTVSAAWGKSLS